MKYRSPHEIPSYKATGRERLEYFSCFLDTLAPERFTFSRWYGHGKGCAVGLAAAMDRWVQAQGLRLEHDDSLKDCGPVYEREMDWDAVAGFFELTHSEVKRLFSPIGYDGELRPHPRKVAAKIRAFLAVTAREDVAA